MIENRNFSKTAPFATLPIFQLKFYCAANRTVGLSYNAQSLFIELKLINIHLGMAQMNTSVIQFLIVFCLLNFFVTQLFDNLKGNVLLSIRISNLVNVLLLKN
jgi:hypothetical protein